MDTREVGNGRAWTGQESGTLSLAKVRTCKNSIRQILSEDTSLKLPMSVSASSDVFITLFVWVFQAASPVHKSFHRAASMHFLENFVALCNSTTVSFSAYIVNFASLDTIEPIVYASSMGTGWVNDSHLESLETLSPR